MSQELTEYTFANNSLCPRCFKVCDDLVRYEGCNLCGMKTPQGMGLMSARIPKMYLQKVLDNNPGIILR